MERRDSRSFEKTCLFLLATIGFSVVFSCLLFIFSIYPDTGGTDTFGHLFKINYLHNSLKEGVLYPIYTEYWYNGMELFRYWPPLSYYVVALLQFLVKGDVIYAFYLFAGVAYFINMIGWLLIGRLEHRIGIAFLMGNLFFFCPDNLRIFMAEGNIPRIFIGVLLPYAFYCVWAVLNYQKYRKLVGLAVVIWLITVSHYMIAAMAGVAIFLFCAIYCLMNKVWRQIVFVTVDLVLAYLASGIFLIPGLTGGGLTSQNSEASVATVGMWAQEALKSLNPLLRFQNDMGNFYFGLAIFVIACLGIVAANRKMGPGFITTIVIFVCTTEAVSEVIKLLPLSQVFWMQRFVPMAMCIFFLSLLLWKQLKKSAIIVLTIFMLIDSVVAAYVLMDARTDEVEELAVAYMDEYMVTEAVAITENRMGILDKSMLGAIPSWYLSKDMNEESVLYSFGWAYQGAETMDNIVSINEAVESEYFEYAFDRLLELGDDTVLIDKNMVSEEQFEKMHRAASLIGYELYAENEKAWLYHIPEAKGYFGVVKQYKNLAIGDQAEAICYIYPQFGQGSSTVIDEYTVEELAGYQKIYLSGFTYDDKETAEKILNEVANRGVKIYIDMQHIPMDSLSGKAEFLDVYAQHVAFTEKFPVLSTDNGSQFRLDSRTAGYDVWNTVYISGADERIKEAYYDNTTNLTYVARHGNENIVFLGLNPVYYYLEDRIPQLLTFLNETFEEEPRQICESELVPMEVDYGARQLVIKTGRDQVVTGISNLDCFVKKDGSDKLSSHNMLMVNSGTTIYKVQYTNLVSGGIVSAVGIVGCIVFWGIMYRRQRREEQK